ncbi:hypothetical protein ALC62_01153 [Cyphomyrmex costatus]|uniref:DDE Tnp4 domain-containing protein n=1 Tax=Cyphomyrmex costatus TaxID=456900 RepID=A0A151IPV8_9HYME|nr:hypothetical protein ALC62_01153 [Cyphomyrmex costatus]
MLLLRKKRQKRWLNRRWLVSPINQKRIQKGDYNNLFQEIKNDPDFFYRYTRMTLEHFEKLVELTKPYLIKASSSSSLYLSSPTEEDWMKYAQGYWKRWNIPNCVGSIDGKHIRMRCPPNSGSLYYNYKKYYSIVLLAVADHLYRFTLVDIGAFGGKQLEIKQTSHNLVYGAKFLKCPDQKIKVFQFGQNFTKMLLLSVKV